MWQLIESSTARVTKSLAMEFSEMEPVRNDRPLNERRLNLYRQMLDKGEFRPVTWASILCEETGVTYRVNGKHTSTMLAQMDEVPKFTVTVERYIGETLEDSIRLYSTFDGSVSTRTTGEINNSFAGVIPELNGFPRKHINLAVTGISFHKWGPSYTQRPAPERAELLLDYTEYAVWLGGILGASSESKHLQRGPVCSAMLGCFEKNRKQATAFWEAVRDETGEKPTLPDRKLAKWLVMNSVFMGSGASKPIRRRASQKEFYVRCIHGWNAWRRGESTDLRYYASAKPPAFV